MDDILGNIYSLLIALVGSLYELVSKAFELFYVLAEASTVDKSVYENVVKNFYLIIGIVMLFTIAFSLLKSMVSSDDDKGTANAGKIVTNFVTSIIILLVLPTIFSFAFSFQTAVVNQNTIGRIFGMNATESSGDSIASAGNEMANSVFTAFFTPSDDFCNKNKEENKECSELLKNDDGTTLYQAIGSVNKNGWFGIYSDFGNQVAEGDIAFNFFMLLIAGLFLLYVVVSFCLDLGVRLVKLVFYQIIAPIPVFMRVVPDGKLSNTFNDWTKITITCYIEVFLRLLIIYFGVFLVSAFLNDKGLGEIFSGLNGSIGLIAKAILVLSIVVFMKQAPQLIGDLFGIDSSKMKLGIMDKLAAGGMLAAGAFAGGALTTGTQNFTSKFKENRLAGRGKLASAGLALTKGGGSILAGTISGGVRSGRAGLNAKSFKDMKEAASSGSTAAVDARNKRANYKAAHGGFVGSLKGHVKDFGNSAKNFAYDESIEGLTRESKSMGEITSSYNTFNDTIENLLEKEQAKGEKSVFFENGFNLTNYNAFDEAAQELAHKRARFNAGALSAEELRSAESAYIQARDAVRDELMNMSLEGSNGAAYGELSDKGKAALKDSLVNAESLQATILANASTKVVQDIMGDDGNNALSKIINGTPLNVDDFKHNDSKLKDVAKVAQGAAEIKIAEMNKEQAAKGDNK